MEAPLSFKNGHVIVLEKVFVIGWRKEILWTRDDEGLIKSERCLILDDCFIIQKIQYIQ